MQNAAAQFTLTIDQVTAVETQLKTQGVSTALIGRPTSLQYVATSETSGTLYVGTPILTQVQAALTALNIRTT